MFYRHEELNNWPQATLGNRLCMSRRLISEYVEVNKADWYTEPSRIKMLPDVGMVKVYPKYVLKAANVHWVVTLTRNTSPCSWTFSTSWFFHAATSGIRDIVHHPYISTTLKSVICQLPHSALICTKECNPSNAA